MGGKILLLISAYVLTATEGMYHFNIYVLAEIDSKKSSQACISKLCMEVDYCNFKKHCSNQT